MRLRHAAVCLCSLASLAAATPMRQEGPLVARAEQLFRSSTPMSLATPADILKLHQEGDITLNLLTLTGRQVADSLAQGLMPDASMAQRVFAGFSWNEEGVLQLKAGGLGGRALQGLALARPLGLAPEARERLLKAGVDAATVAALALPALPALPPLKDLSTPAMGSGAMMQNPAVKAQMEKAMQGMREKMNAHFRSDQFRQELWQRILETWRTRIQVGADPEATLEPAKTDMVMDIGAPVAPGQNAVAAGRAANELLQSSALSAVLDTAEVINALRAKATVAVKLSDPVAMPAYSPAQAGTFHMRKNPSELVLVRLQDTQGVVTAHFAKGVFFGTDLKPADEAVAVSSSREGDCWTIQPAAPLLPGAYAFLMGGKNMLVIPFRVN